MLTSPEAQGSPQTPSDLYNSFPSSFFSLLPPSLPFSLLLFLFSSLPSHLPPSLLHIFLPSFLSIILFSRKGQWLPSLLPFAPGKTGGETASLGSENWV